MTDYRVSCPKCGETLIAEGGTVAMDRLVAENQRLRAVLEEFAKDADAGNAEGWYGAKAKEALKTQ